MELNKILLMEFAQVHQTFISELYSRLDEYLTIQADIELDSLLLYDILRFFFIFRWEDKFTQLWWLENTGGIGFIKCVRLL